MRFGKICLRIVTLGSISLALLACSEEPVTTTTPSTPPAKPLPDLSDALEKRVTGKPEEAVELLRRHNKDFPDSPEILTHLGRALFDSEQFAESAFRFDQALSAGARKELLKEAALAYLKAGDAGSAESRYSGYLEQNPDDKEARLAYGRVLAKAGKHTEALNAFGMATEHATHEDCLIMAELFFQKNLLVQAEHWYRESARKEDGITPRPLLGLLRVKLATGDESSAEALVLAIEKSNPGTIEGSGLSGEAAELLRKRRGSDYSERGLSPGEMTISELASALLSVASSPATEEPVVSRGPKTSPADPLEPSDEPQPQPTEPIPGPAGDGLSLADAFASPVREEPDHLEQGRAAFVTGNYTSALLSARKAIKDNPESSDAWRLSSQSHFQLGEVREAEMTILEAIRHNPDDLQTYMEYLRIARETLPGPRYLNELEKAHERFPDSTEILWQLARRYHLVERMPVTAGILYRKLIEKAPKGSAIGQQAEMELIKIQNL